MVTPRSLGLPPWCEVKTTIVLYFGAEPDRSIPILLPGVGMDAGPDCSRDGVPATPLSVAAAAPPVVGELLSFAALTAPPVAAGGGVAPAEPAQQSAEIKTGALKIVYMSSSPSCGGRAGVKLVLYAYSAVSS